MGAPAGQPCRTTTSATGRPMPVSRSQSRSGQVTADSGGREEVRCVQHDPVFSMKSSRGPTALLPLRQPARDKVPNILLVDAPCRDFPLGRVPTHLRSHIVDNSVMICRAPRWSVTQFRPVTPELVVLYHRAQEYAFERPQYGSIWSKCQAARRARDDVVQLVTIVASATVGRDSNRLGVVSSGPTSTATCPKPTSSTLMLR